MKEMKCHIGPSVNQVWLLSFVNSLLFWHFISTTAFKQCMIVNYDSRVTILSIF